MQRQIVGNTNPVDFDNEVNSVRKQRQRNKPSFDTSEKINSNREPFLLVQTSFTLFFLAIEPLNVYVTAM